jgi:hypothetical protein
MEAVSSGDDVKLAAFLLDLPVEEVQRVAGDMT